MQWFPNASVAYQFERFSEENNQKEFQKRGNKTVRDTKDIKIFPVVVAVVYVNMGRLYVLLLSIIVQIEYFLTSLIRFEQFYSQNILDSGFTLIGSLIIALFQWSMFC